MSADFLFLRRCGLVSAVGFGWEASCAAIRAAIDGFVETHFIADGGGWIRGAVVPLDPPLRALPRHARLLALALEEAMEGIDATATPLLMLLAEETRPGAPVASGNDLFRETCHLLDASFHEASRVIAMGRVGGAVALRDAARLIDEGVCEQVLIAGFDNLVTAGTLRFLDRERRLLTDKSMDGLLPGEAAAAILVSRRPGRVRLAAPGFAIEPATPEGDVPMRAEGLAAAMTGALAAASLELRDIDFRITDLSGEQWRFREAALALHRLLRDRHEDQDIWHPADCIGDVGAATGPVLVGVAAHAMIHGYAPGPRCLAHMGNDDGRRVAFVMESMEPAHVE